MWLNLILCAVIVIQSILFSFERRDMLNRLMAKNLSEYQQPKSPPLKHIPSAHSKVLKKWRNGSKVGEE